MRLHDPVHRQTWDLIPWLVNDTLDDARRGIVETHLRECADCREELAFQRKVHAGIVDDSPTAAAPTAMSQLFERIDAEDEAIPADRGFDPLEAELASPVSAPAKTERRLRLGHLLAAAVIVEAVGLVGLGTMLAGQRDAAADYATLSQSTRPVAGARIRLVPSPSLNVGELQVLLGKSGLHIVDSNAGGTILALGFESSSTLQENTEALESRRRIDEALQQLRANPGVLLAEPILSSTAAPH
jgi:anti-sigma factor RsiW